MIQELPQTMDLQQDGASLHCTNAVRQPLDSEVPDVWIDRGGPTNWQLPLQIERHVTFPCGNMLITKSFKPAILG